MIVVGADGRRENRKESEELKLRRLQGAVRIKGGKTRRRKKKMAIKRWEGENEELKLEIPNENKNKVRLKEKFCWDREGEEVTGSREQAKI